MKVLIFGNSGAGKSTLAKKLAEAENLPHLDLDTLAWLPVTPTQRAPVDSSAEEIHKFAEANTGWVIEGCYTDLLEIAEPFSSEIIFMNLSIEQCIENARNRPWEPHKYESQQAQDANLEMLIGWIEDYYQRKDTFSYASHLRFYEGFEGKKNMITENQRDLTNE